MTRPLQAEQAVLGGIMLDPSAYWRVQPLLTAEDFTRKDHALIWQALSEFAEQGRPTDAVTLGEWFDAAGKMAEVAGGAYLIELHSGTPSAANVVAYAKIVAEASETRRVREAGKRIALATTFTEGQELLTAAAPRRLSMLKGSKDGIEEMLETLQRRFDSEGGLTGVPTGIESLDELTGGWQPGNLIVVAGRPGMGKSAFAVQTAIAAERALFISLEMTTGELTERMISNIGHIPNRWFRFPKDAPEYAMTEIANACRKVPKRLSFEDTPGLSIDAIEGVIRQAHMADPLRLVIVDHLGLVAREGKHDPSELGLITSRLKRLAKEIAPVVLLCQLNRGLESRTNKRPELSDLRDSGRIEEDADIVIGLYRDSYYSQKPDPDSDFMEMIVRKNRNGEQGTAWALSRLGQMRLESMAAPTNTDSPKSAGFAGKYAKAANWEEP